VRFSGKLAEGSESVQELLIGRQKMALQRMDLQELRLLGGWLCLDFVNSIENRAGHPPEDFLTSYPDLARWSRHAGLIDGATATRLMALAAADEPGAVRALANALALREALHRLFLAIATGDHPASADLTHVQRTWARAINAATLVRLDRHFAWEWREIPHLEQPLWPVVHSAIELLTAGDLGRVKVCENPYGCGWLFYDGSKNGSRRWCSMGGCGSQVKMRRQYARRRATGSA
jgi:predicted RNA-binding Zn ribbon-like protein